MSLLCYVDVETLGLHSRTTGVTQIAAIIVRDGREVSRINLDINTFSYNKDVTISKKALEITGKTIEGVKRYPSATVGYIKLISFLNAHRNLGEYYKMVAYRTSFDLLFLEDFFKDQSGEPRKLYDFFEYKTLDIFDTVKLASLLGVHKLKNEKLETACNHYKIDIRAHDALSDISASRKVYKKVLVAMGVAESKVRVL